ncbi:hypothetical protein R8Z50_26820 [Longispora sp. K20-0274]|uniref:hypothetical protein n=1 Tax=Longispora sp. K20-0274 TaxID=3088255 RepID=UPI00399B87C9
MLTSDLTAATLLGAGIALVGQALAFGGIILNNVLTRRREHAKADLERGERSRALQREAVAEVIKAGKIYFRAADAMTIVLAGYSDQIAVANHSQTEVVGRALADFDLAIARADLVVMDREVRQFLEGELGQANELIGERFGEMMSAPRTSKGLANPEAFGRATGTIKRLVSRLQEMAQVARTRLVIESDV